MSADNGWSEYSKLVLKELSSLATNIESRNCKNERARRPGRRIKVLERKN